MVLDFLHGSPDLLLKSVDIGLDPWTSERRPSSRAGAAGLLREFLGEAPGPPAAGKENHMAIAKTTVVFAGDLDAKFVGDKPLGG